MADWRRTLHGPPYMPRVRQFGSCHIGAQLEGKPLNARHRSLFLVMVAFLAAVIKSTASKKISQKVAAGTGAHPGQHVQAALHEPTAHHKFNDTQKTRMTVQPRAMLVNISTI